MENIFSVPWESLGAEHVEAFLREATEEGLVWEAKGREQPNRGSVRKAACGFANSRGGFLILGAEQGDEGWTLPGLPFEVDEPGTWLSSVLIAGLNPVPAFDVKVWDRDERRKAVVLRVEPVSVPPCLTSDGIAYERTSGQTIRVTDPAVLSRLTERGEVARASAQRIAQQAASGLFSHPPPEASGTSIVSVAVATTGTAEDRTARLFNEEFAHKVFADIAVRLQPDPVLRARPQTSVNRTALQGVTVTPTGDSAWSMRASWDGSVSLLFSAKDQAWMIGELVSFMERAWKTATYLLEKLHESGPAYMAAVVRSSPRWDADPNVSIDIGRWTEVREPDPAEIASVARELRRDRGEPAWEPPPE